MGSNAGDDELRIEASQRASAEGVAAHPDLGSAIASLLPNPIDKRRSALGWAAALLFIGCALVIVYGLATGTKPLKENATADAFVIGLIVGGILLYIRSKMGWYKGDEIVVYERGAAAGQKKLRWDQYPRLALGWNLTRYRRAGSSTVHSTSETMSIRLTASGIELLSFGSAVRMSEMYDVFASRVATMIARAHRRKIEDEGLGVDYGFAKATSQGISFDKGSIPWGECGEVENRAGNFSVRSRDGKSVLVFPAERAEAHVFAELVRQKSG